MAENKKSFINYCDWESVFSMLSDEEAGKLIKHIYAFVNDKNPVMEDRLLQMAFEPIKLSLKRDLKKYENVKEKRAEAGRIGGIKSGEARKQNIINEANEANASISKQKQAKEAVNDNVSDSVNDTVNVNVIKKEKSFPVMPKVEDVGELPELKINSSIELLRITQQTDATKIDIEKLWVVFKIQNLTGKKYYADVEAVHSHFINWVKTQRITKPIRAPEKEKQSTPLRTADYYK